MSAIVEKIEFVFENCETMQIDAKYFGMLLIEGIHEGIARIAVNAISKQKIADTVVMEIFREGNDTYDPFGDSDDRKKKFDRIMLWHDITQIEVFYDDGTSENYLVDYKEVQEDVLGSPNRNQKVYLSDLGNLYLVIKAGKETTDYFDKDNINDSEAVRFRKSMIIED